MKFLIAIVTLYAWFQWIPILGMWVAGVRLRNGYENIIDNGAVAYGGEPSYGFAATVAHAPVLRSTHSQMIDQERLPSALPDLQASLSLQ